MEIGFWKKGKRPRFFVHFLLLVIFAVGFLVIMCLRNYIYDSGKCFYATQRQIDELRKSKVGAALLEDVLLSSRVPRPGRSIFFIDTTCNSFNRCDQPVPGFPSGYSCSTYIRAANLSFRQACAIESAARHNPQLDIFVFFTSPAYFPKGVTEGVLFSLCSYSNVYLRYLNVWTFLRNTSKNNDPDSFLEKQIFSSSYPVENLSDFLRLAVLWKWGGTYMDMDLIVLRSLEDLKSNYVGAESKKFVGSAIINLEPEGFGHRIAEKLIFEFQQNFNYHNWGYNGPRLLTRVLMNICDVSDVPEFLTPGRCDGFRVLPTNLFYEVSSKEWTHFFEAEYTNITLSRISISYVSHIWNHFSKSTTVSKNKASAYVKMAEKNCPKVYAQENSIF